MWKLGHWQDFWQCKFLIVHCFVLWERSWEKATLILSLLVQQTFCFFFLFLLFLFKVQLIISLHKTSHMFGGKVAAVSSSRSADTLKPSKSNWSSSQTGTMTSMSVVLCFLSYKLRSEHSERDSVVGWNSFIGTNKEDQMKQAVHHKDPKHRGDFKKGTHAVNVFLQIEAGVVS